MLPTPYPWSLDEFPHLSVIHLAMLFRSSNYTEQGASEAYEIMLWQLILITVLSHQKAHMDL